MMRDSDVRATLRAAMLAWHGPEPRTRILDEFSLHEGETRVDLVAVCEALHGYEIKSDADTLGRLPTQARRYSEVLDFATLVVGERHHSSAKRMVPSWWGVMTAVPIRRGLVRLYPDRPAAPNPEVDPMAVAGLLWREEAHALLEEMDAAQGLMGKPKRVLAYRLCQVYPPDTLALRVRELLKIRPEWSDLRSAT